MALVNDDELSGLKAEATKDRAAADDGFAAAMLPTAEVNADCETPNVAALFINAAMATVASAALRPLNAAATAAGSVGFAAIAAVAAATGSGVPGVTLDWPEVTFALPELPAETVTVLPLQM